MLVALGLAGMGHEVNFAWLPYAAWDIKIDTFDLRKQDPTPGTFCPGGKGDATQQPAQSALDAGAKPNLDPQLRRIVDQVSDYDTQYTLQVEETDTNSRSIFCARSATGSGCRHPGLA